MSKSFSSYAAHAGVISERDVAWSVPRAAGAFRESRH